MKIGCCYFMKIKKQCFQESKATIISMQTHHKSTAYDAYGVLLMFDFKVFIYQCLTYIR